MDFSSQNIATTGNRDLTCFPPHGCFTQTSRRYDGFSSFSTNANFQKKCNFFFAFKTQKRNEANENETKRRIISPKGQFVSSLVKSLHCILSFRIQATSRAVQNMITVIMKPKSWNDKNVRWLPFFERLRFREILKTSQKQSYTFFEQSCFHKIAKCSTPLGSFKQNRTRGKNTKSRLGVVACLIGHTSAIPGGERKVWQNHADGPYVFKNIQKSNLFIH